MSYRVPLRFASKLKPAERNNDINRVHLDGIQRGHLRLGEQP